MALWSALPLSARAATADYAWVTHAFSATNYQGNCGVAAIGATLYLVGGEQVSGTTTVISRNLRAYDTVTGETWNRAPLLFDQRANKAVAVGNKIYCLGGMDAGGSNTNYVEVWDADTDTWTGKASMPSIYYNFQVAVVGNEIYTLTANDLNSYNVLSDSWIPKHRLGLTGPGETAPLDNAAMTAIGSNLYVAGGDAYGGSSNTLWIYSVPGDSWTRGPAFPAIRIGSAAFAANGNYYIVGGNALDGHWGPHTLWEYDATAGQWVARSKGDVMTSGAQAVVSEGNAWVAGGCCIDRNVYAGYPDNAPVLTWAGGDHFASTGVYPSVGRPSEPVEFRIMYSDPDGDAPTDIYVHINANGSFAEVASLAPGAGDDLNGRVYATTWTHGHEGVSYTYWFTAKDRYGMDAAGSPASITAGLTDLSFSNGVLIPSDLDRNLPEPGKIQVRNTVVKVAEGARGYVVIRSRQPGARVNVNLFSSAGRPVTGLGGGQQTTDSAGLLTVEINGLIDGKPLPSGLYWVVVTGDVNDKQAIVIVSGR